MKVFSNYAKYYNLLYKDKNYNSEVCYIESLFEKYSDFKVSSILDLGCGTGNHDFIFYEKGYKVFGVDIASEMIDVAKKSARIITSPNKPEFKVADVRNFNSGKKFDAVISLFHVASYQNTNDDLLNFFRSAANNVKKGGLFIFDSWYGPAVLTDRPVVRIKRLEDNQISVTRVAEPVFHPNENTVDVNYTVSIVDKKTGKIEEIKEVHKMRYLFLTEVLEFAANFGFKVLKAEEWITGKSLGFNTWNSCFILKNN